MKESVEMCLPPFQFWLDQYFLRDPIQNQLRYPKTYKNFFDLKLKISVDPDSKNPRFFFLHLVCSLLSSWFLDTYVVVYIPVCFCFRSPSEWRSSKGEVSWLVLISSQVGHPLWTWTLPRKYQNRCSNLYLVLYLWVSLTNEDKE